jgi:hypothetical protein
MTPHMPKNLAMFSNVGIDEAIIRYPKGASKTSYNAAMRVFGTTLIVLCCLTQISSPGQQPAPSSGAWNTASVIENRPQAGENRHTDWTTAIPLWAGLLGFLEVLWATKKRRRR